MELRKTAQQLRDEHLDQGMPRDRDGFEYVIEILEEAESFGLGHIKRRMQPRQWIRCQWLLESWGVIDPEI